MKFPSEFKLMCFLEEGGRPEIPEDCAYKEVMKKCWQGKKESRPSFKYCTFYLHFHFHFLFLLFLDNSEIVPILEALIVQPIGPSQSVVLRMSQPDPMLLDERVQRPQSVILRKSGGQFKFDISDDKSEAVAPLLSINNADSKRKKERAVTLNEKGTQK